MSSITSYCPNCGYTLLQSYGEVCPQCNAPSQTAPPEQDRLWGVGTGLGVWILSVLLVVGLPIIPGVIYFAVKMYQTGQMPQSPEKDLGFVLVTIGFTFPAHLLTLLICWLIVTRRGDRSFYQTLGWEWHPQFKWVHAVGLAFLMTGAGFLFEKYLPHRETDLEMLLKLGISVRIMVAALAVLTAPLVEEVVYRGVLYSGIARDWGKGASVAAVTLLFGLVHAPQYWGSYAAISAILSLSLVLTLLRAWTGKLLPCIATHLVYNGIQAIGLLVSPDESPDKIHAQSVIVSIFQSLFQNLGLS